MKNPFSSLKEKVTQYIRLRYEEVRLELIERLVNVMGYFAFIIIAAFLFFFAFIFLGFGLAAWLGALFHSRSAGLFATGGLFLIIALVVIKLSQRIIRFFSGKMVYLMTKPKKEDEEPEEAEG